MSRLINDISNRVEAVTTNHQVLLDDVDFCKNRFNALAQAEKSVRGENIIIGSLGFDGHNVQLNSIPEAVEPMFKWVFSSTDSPGPPRSGGDLKKWLRRGYGIGLVTGESGCGKSMLMKHISMHPDLIGTLYQWSSPQSVIIASHFFCKTGTRLQRSRQGLLQTLLRSLLLQLPGETEAIYRKQRPTHPEKLRDHRWTVNELEEQILEILKSHSDIKFCFFVDGVDDYDGDKTELAFCLQRLMAGNGKICLSSTADDIISFFTVKVEKFPIGGRFLRNDLEIFLKKQLESHPIYEHTSATEHLEIARAASEKYRNFLWARIAIEQLRIQHRSQHTLQDTKRLLDELPSRPVALVKQCLRTTPASLAPSGAFFFKIAIAAKDPPPISIFHFLALEEKDPDYALKLDHKALDQDEIRTSTKKSLERRCGVFLEVRPDSRVAFPHLAIYNIFSSVDVSAALGAMSSSKDPVHLSLARAYLAYMKTTKFSWGRPTFSYTWLRVPSYATALAEFLDIVRECNTSQVYLLLDNWERCFIPKSKTDQQQLDAEDRVHVNSSQHFRRPILDALLRGYITYRLKRQPSFLDTLLDDDHRMCPPALSHILASMFNAPQNRRGEHIKLLQSLLRLQFDPNKSYQNGRPTYTPWTDLVRAAVRPPDLKWTLHSGLLSMFLDNKANPNSPVWDMHPPILGAQRRNFTSSWVLLVCTISDALHSRRVVFNDADRKACFTMMDSLYKAGASAEYRPSCDFFNSPELSTDVAWAQALVTQTLESGRSYPLAADSLQAGLVERVLTILVRSRFGVGWSSELLQRCLSSEAVEVINAKVMEEQKVVEHGTASATGSPSTVKRSSDEMVMDGETSSKRARSETGDETMTLTMTMRMETSA
jgi:hypothetical protein